YLAWPTDRASYGRLTSLLSRGRIAAEKGSCELRCPDLLAHAEGLVLAALPPELPDAGFAESLRGASCWSASGRASRRPRRQGAMRAELPPLAERPTRSSGSGLMG
ncbi:hypothetical protein ACFQX4_27625, partial [Roseomonas sp. GCM10028921]